MFKLIIIITLILMTSQFASAQQWMTGKWAGKGREVSGKTWTMKLRAKNKRFSVEYPSLKCSGEWQLISFNRYKARFRENIKVNRKACEPTGNVYIQRLRNNRLLFTYSYLGSSKKTATAWLRRKY